MSVFRGAMLDAALEDAWRAGDEGTYRALEEHAFDLADRDLVVITFDMYGFVRVDDR